MIFLEKMVEWYHESDFLVSNLSLYTCRGLCLKAILIPSGYEKIITFGAPFLVKEVLREKYSWPST